METIIIIKQYMRTLRLVLENHELDNEEYNAIEFGLELAEEELYRYLRAEQAEINVIKDAGMMN